MQINALGRLPMPRYLQPPTDSFFRVPGELPAGRCDVWHTARSHERVMHPGLQPVGLVVVSLGNRESEKPYGGHRPHPGQSLCRLPGHRRVLDVQQQPHQRFLSLRNISEGSKVTPGTNTLGPRRRRRLSQGCLQPTRHLWHDQTVSRPHRRSNPGQRLPSRLTKNIEVPRSRWAGLGLEPLQP